MSLPLISALMMRRILVAELSFGAFGVGVIAFCLFNVLVYKFLSEIL